MHQRQVQKHVVLNFWGAREIFYIFVIILFFLYDDPKACGDFRSLDLILVLW